MPPRIHEQPGYLAYQPAAFQLLRAIDFPELDKLIATYPAAATTLQPTLKIRVRTPNVRMRTRVVFALAPLASPATDVDTAANTSVLTGTGLLWGAIFQRVRDNTGKPIPTRDLVGNKSTPLAVPTDAGLWGWEGEWETCGDEMAFFFVPPKAKVGNTVAAAWHVLVSYEAVQRLGDEEWQQMRQGYSLETPSPVVLT